MLTSGRQLSFSRLGDGAVPLVLLHGFLGAGRNLTTLAKRLVAKDPALTIVLPDLTGHGASPPLPPGADLGTLADDVLALIASLGLAPPVAIMGHSLGGRVALAATLRAPGTFSRVTLLDITPSPIAPRVGSLESAALVAAMVAAPASAPSRQVYRDHLAAAGVRPVLIDWQMLNLVQDGEVWRWRMDPRALADLHPRVNAADLWAAVERPDRPYELHAVRGARSPYLDDADAARLAAAGCRVDTIAGAGHFVHVDGLDALVELVTRRPA
jgi:pimeloyl-ACP methyl ester carboxylesterase